MVILSQKGNAAVAGNHNSGRRPRPTALKVFKGTRPDRINALEPRPAAGEPVRPALSPLASAVWALEAPRLVALGILTQSDGRAFAQLCELLATAELITAEKTTPEFRPFVTKASTDGTGAVVHLEPREHPLLKMERQTAGALKPYLAMFGLEPSSRSRLKATQAPEENRLREFLTRGHRGA
jgi:P27 family predicted phage terminase small subunit